MNSRRLLAVAARIVPDAAGSAYASEWRSALTARIDGVVVATPISYRAEITFVAMRATSLEPEME